MVLTSKRKGATTTMQLITKSITDEFTFTLLSELAGERPAYYVWSLHLDNLPNSFPEGQVILCVKDVLHDDYLQKLTDTDPGKFVVCTSLENLVLANAKIVRMGGDWLNQISQYQDLEPIRSKNFASQYVISLNRNPRHHRVTAASYLAGTCCPAIITTLIKDHQTFTDAVPWDLSALSSEQMDALNAGYTCLESSDPDIYSSLGQLNNIANFEVNLRPMYAGSLVEIVGETSFDEAAFNLTEKTMHCFAAFNFPIILSSCGTVQFLRSIGFDMFDDIVDHSYDLVKDPAKRVVTAIDNNYILMHNRDLAKQKWQECLPRFEKNWEFVSSGKLAAWYAARTKLEFLNAIQVDK